MRFNSGLKGLNVIQEKRSSLNIVKKHYSFKKCYGLFVSGFQQ
jgi:hypothetical protein